MRLGKRLTDGNILRLDTELGGNMKKTKATCDAIEALHDDEMCSWYMGIDGKYPDDMAAIDLKTLARDYQAVCAERDELTKWRLALESLTPGGSEFVNDLPRCLEQIQRQRGREHQTAIDAVKEKRAVCAERDRLRAVLDAADEIKFKGGDEIFIGTESGLCYSQNRFDTDPANVWKRYGKWSADAVLEAFAALQGDEGGSDE
jgi:hypothetical protein